VDPQALDRQVYDAILKATETEPELSDAISDLGPSTLAALNLCDNELQRAVGSHAGRIAFSVGFDLAMDLCRIVNANPGDPDENEVKAALARAAAEITLLKENLAYA